MKKTILSSIFLFGFLCNAQDNLTGGIPVSDVKLVKREKKEKIVNTQSSILNRDTRDLIISPIDPLDPIDPIDPLDPIDPIDSGDNPPSGANPTGFIKGDLNVSLSGSATYSIPIALPPGISGTIPEINLTYNSQGGNGIAGYGWNVSGLSTITRIGTTKFHDNIVDGVDFDALDRFAFDGQRLMLKSGVYGSDGAEYQTENYTNIKITSHGVSSFGTNFGPAYFIVHYPDGSKAYYGQNVNSRSRTDWAITYWENPLGIRISYEYMTYNNIIYISKIKYGSLGNQTAINEIQFIYKLRNRKEQYYVGGVSFINDKILSQIKVIGNNIGYRNYHLTYGTTSLGYERLISITEKTGDNLNSLNPTTFSYIDTIDEINQSGTTTSLSLSQINSTNSGTISGDFDGDGSLDVIIYPKTGTNANNKYWLFTDLSNTNTYNIGAEHNIGNFKKIFPISWLNHTNKLMPQQGWSVVKYNEYSGVTSFNNYSAGIASPIYFQYTKEYQFPRITIGNVVVNVEIPKKYIEGDFNGDGLTDLLVVEKSKSYSYTSGGTTINGTHQGGRTFFIDLDRRNVNFANLAGNISSNDDSIFHVGDFNGDGKSDLFVFNNGTLKVYGINSNNQIEIFCNYSDSQIDITRELLLGDYNGDGKIDLLIPIKHSSSYIQYESNGVSFVKFNKSFSFYYNGSNQQFLANDFDLDGKTDLLQLTYSFNHESINGSRFDQIWVVLHGNVGTNFNQSCHRKIYLPNDGLVALPMYLNSSMRNLKSELAFMVNDKIYYAYGKKNFSKEKLLKEITLGNGVKETITYQSLTGNGEVNLEDIQFYTPTTYTENYPNHDIKLSPTFDVVSLIEHRSKNQYKKRAFGYYGAVSNLEGLGFLGFRGILKTNWYSNINNRLSTITKHDINKRGAIIESYTVLNTMFNFYNSPTSFVSKTVNNYEDELLPNKVYRINKTSSFVNNGLDNTAKEAITAYDNFNNPIQNIVNYKLGTSTQKTEKTDYIYENILNTNSHIIGRPIQKNTEVTYNSATMTSEEVYLYNTQNLLSKIKRKGNGTDYLTEDNIYDVFGNITQKTITAVGLTPRITSYEYDPSGRFLTKTIDIEGLETKYTSSNVTGQLIKETNPYGLITQYYYDDWLRKTKVVDYLGNEKLYSYAMFGTTDVIVTTLNDEGSESLVIFDDLGREIISGSKNIDDSWSYVKSEYDIQDRKIKVSEPYADFSGSPSQFNLSSFDVYGRLIQTVSYTGKTSNINYSGLVTTINDGFKTVSTTKNAVDLTVSMTDNGGTITYQHYPNGNLKQSDFNGVVIDVEQDGWGRKIKLTDPSAGIYEYKYNDFGELTWEKTPKGETTYTLSTHGKLIQKEVIGDNTHLISYYNYDGTSKLLTGITTNTSTSYSYEYDTYQRLWRTTEFSPYAQYQIATIFDSFGRAEKEYQHSLHVPTGKSSSKWIKNTFKNGFHWQILDDITNQVLWEINSVNSRGQLTRASLGNGIGISKNYDNFGFITRSKHDLIGTTPVPVNIMTLNTTFEPQRGNLTSRYNSMFTWNENFQYDALDRLTHYTDATGSQVQQIYDDRGRITDNNQGHYNYSGPIYQNSSIDPTPTAFNYYQNRSNLDITYNAFKSPVEIFEDGFDRISFDYNMLQNRSTMYYGSLETDKLQRKYRKHYSTLGALEIKHNTQTNDVEFLTYIGGDGYSAPVVLKSDGTSQNYLYLHRDYLGSIVAVTNHVGQILEKRIFDAWGLIVKVQDGSGNILSGLVVLDRGYTGHEHLQGVNLIHMNGRLYDPLVHRFLQPDNFIQDPYNTQNYNRYGYVLNNPLKWIDPSGESFSSWWKSNWKQVVTVAAAVVVGVTVTILTGGTAAPLLVSFYAGMAAGATGGIVGTALNGGSAGDIITAGITGGMMGGIMGLAGGYVASFAPPGIINGALYGGSTNAVLGGLSDIVMGGDGKQAALMGFGFGAIGGGAQGYASAKASGANIWTGKMPTPKPSVLGSGLNESLEIALDAHNNKAAEISFKAQAEPTVSEPTFYRGGRSMELSKADIRSGLDKTTGFMKPGKGLSLNTDKYNRFIDAYGGAFEVDLSSIPNNLEIINTPIGSSHFVISPVKLMSPAEFQNSLNQVRLIQYNKLF